MGFPNHVRAGEINSTVVRWMHQHVASSPNLVCAFTVNATPTTTSCFLLHNPRVSWFYKDLFISRKLKRCRNSPIVISLTTITAGETTKTSRQETAGTGGGVVAASVLPKALCHPRKSPLRKWPLAMSTRANDMWRSVFGICACVFARWYSWCSWFDLDMVSYSIIGIWWHTITDVNMYFKKAIRK